MSSRSPAHSAETRSVWLRFLDAFLQEQNIKWLLMIGMLILVGSSLIPVTTHWDEYNSFWQYAIIFGYTGLIHFAGQWTYHKLALKRTGTVLMAMTVLLLPITFLALHWIQGTGDGAAAIPALPSATVINLILVGINTVFSALIARRVFNHLLRGHQPTFVISYLLLCLAGALVPAITPESRPWVFPLLWAAFTAGTVKVNRHVFWLAEEQRWPRIAGFFPIGLLGAQFLGLCAYSFIPHASLQWVGLAAVVTAIPVLLTSDAVARVFQQRTGNIVRPLPWNISLPLVIGLILCAGGVCLSAVELPSHREFALVPSAALAAAMMVVVARRTGHSAFVWAMLIGITIAYNFSHVYFQEFAIMVRDQGAVAVREARLPYAFYGLTYIPLLLALTVATRLLERGGDRLFSKNMKAFGVGLSALLMILATTHVKALLPVSAVMTALFALQTWLFRDRRYLIAAVIAWFIAAAGVTPFAVGVLEMSLPFGASLVCLAIAAVVSLPLAETLHRRYLQSLAFNPKAPDLVQEKAVSQSINWMVFGMLALVEVASLTIFDWPTRAAGLIALTGLVAFYVLRRQPGFRLPALALVNWQLIAIVLQLCCPAMHWLWVFDFPGFLAASPLIALAAAVSLAIWEVRGPHGDSWSSALVVVHRTALALLSAVALATSLDLTVIEPIQAMFAIATFGLLAFTGFHAACRRQEETLVWLGEGIIAAAFGYLFYFGVITLGHGVSMYAILGTAIAAWVASRLAAGRDSTEIMVRPFHQTAMILPMVTVAVGVFRHIIQPQPTWLGLRSLAILLAGGFYFWQGIETQRRRFFVLSAAVLNVALALLWRELHWTDPQLFMIPIGFSVLFITEILRKEIPEKLRDPLRYLGALVMLVSPTFHIVGGSWLHLFTLMVVSVVVVLGSIGLRIRALLYTGTAFLIADLIAMVVHGAIDNPNVLWITGVGFGAAIVVLGAVCERNREIILQRLRVLAATLKTWE